MAFSPKHIVGSDMILSVIQSCPKLQSEFRDNRIINK